MGSAFGRGLKPHSFRHGYAALKRRSSTVARASEDETCFEEQIPREAQSESQRCKLHRGLKPHSFGTVTRR
jgi:hypothetical protein